MAGAFPAACSGVGGGNTNTAERAEDQRTASVRGGVSVPVEARMKEGEPARRMLHPGRSSGPRSFSWNNDRFAIGKAGMV